MEQAKSGNTIFDDIQLKDFKALDELMFKKPLSDDQIGFYSKTFRHFPIETINQAFEFFIEQQREKKYTNRPRPKELFLKCKEIENMANSTQEEKDFCTFCKNSGNAYLLWAGDDFFTKFNYSTGDNVHGMRIVKNNKEHFKHTKTSTTYCSCKKGRLLFERDCNTSGKRPLCESWQVILDLDRMGYLKPT